jgi:hypothetical protein
VKTGAIAKALDVSQQYWSALTRGRGNLSEEKLRVLMNLLELDPDEQADLLALREIARGRSPYAEYSALFSDQLMRFYGLEAGAQSIRSFENGVIPGLLQTENYIRVLMKASVTTGRPTEVEQRVKARMQRQRLLSDPEPLELSVVMGQSALMYEVGGPDTQREQLRYIIAQAEKHSETLDIRVIPFEAGGAIASLNSATFHLLDFESARLATVGWTESAAYGDLTEDPKRVTALDYLYNQIQSIALDREGSLNLLDRIASQKLR